MVSLRRCVRILIKGNEKSVYPEIPYCFSISSQCSLMLSFSLVHISVIFSLVNFLLGINFMDKINESPYVQILLVANVRI